MDSSSASASSDDLSLSNIFPEAFHHILSFLSGRENNEDLRVGECSKSLHALVESIILPVRLGPSFAAKINNLDKIHEQMMKLTGRNQMPNRLLARFLERGYPVGCHYNGIGRHFQETTALCSRTTTLPDGMVAFQGFQNGRPSLQVFNPKNNWELVCSSFGSLHIWGISKLLHCQLEDGIYIVSHNQQNYPSGRDQTWCWAWDHSNKELKYQSGHEQGRVENFGKCMNSLAVAQDGTVYEHHFGRGEIRRYDVRRPEDKFVKRLSTNFNLLATESTSFRRATMEVAGDFLLISIESCRGFLFLNRATLEECRFIDAGGSVPCWPGLSVSPNGGTFVVRSNLSGHVSLHAMSIDSHKRTIDHLYTLGARDNFQSTVVLDIRGSMVYVLEASTTIHVYDISSEGKGRLVRSFPIKFYLAGYGLHNGRMKGMAITEAGISLFVTSDDFEVLEIQRFLPLKSSK